jgi:serine protease Do
MRFIACAGKVKKVGMSILLFACAAGGAAFGQERQITRALRVELDGSSYLGIQMEELTADNMAKYKLTSERGAIVRSVEKDSPAEKAGIHDNDVMLEYAGTPVFSAAQLARMVRETPPGRRVDIVVSRDGKKMNLAAEIGKRSGPVGSGRNFDMPPLENDGRNYEWFGPNGRMFQFRLPEGRGFFYGAPGTSGGAAATEKPRLGVTMTPLTDQMAAFLGASGKKGVLITSVEQGSAASTKLKAGDVITQADSQNLDTPDSLARIVQSKDGGKIELKVIRDKKEMSITIELPESGRAGDRRNYRL